MEDAVALHAPGMTVGEAVPILCRYAQPGCGLFLTDEHGTPRATDEPLWTDSMEQDTLYYRMEQADIRIARKAHEALSKEYMRECNFPKIMGVGYVARTDPLDRNCNYMLLIITFDKRFFPGAVVGDALEKTPEGYPSFYRNPEKTYCLPIQYQVSSMIHVY